MAFVKLDTRILESTLWIERDCREVFITALLMAMPQEFVQPMEQYEIRSLDKTGFVVPPGWYGFVDAAGVGIVRRAMVDTELGLDALEKLGSADLESRTSDFAGRRLVRVNGGFIVLNFMKYRDKDNTAAERARRYRERQKAIESAAVTRDCNDDTRDASLAEVRGQSKESKSKKSQKPAPSGVDFGDVSPQVVADFTAHRKAQRAPITQTALDTIRKEANKAGLTLDAALAMCCARGWRGFKADWVSGQLTRSGPATAGKTMQGIQLLERMKNGLADPRDNDRLSETSVPRLGAPARR